MYICNLNQIYRMNFSTDKLFTKMLPKINNSYIIAHLSILSYESWLSIFQSGILIRYSKLLCYFILIKYKWYLVWIPEERKHVIWFILSSEIKFTSFDQLSPPDSNNFLYMPPYSTTKEAGYKANSVTGKRIGSWDINTKFSLYNFQANFIYWWLKFLS